MAPPKTKQFRRRRNSESSNEDSEETSDILETTRELQKIRKRQSGVNAASLATGIKVTKVEEAFMDNDPFKLKTGGLVKMTNIKDRNRDRTYEDVDRDVTNLGSTFSVETNRRDEDAELSAYIESELKRIKGEKSADEVKQKPKPAEDALYELPDHLKIKVGSQSEEMLSNQMLSGIPEVDLGIDVKIKNIERTEEAKLKLVQDLSKKKDSTASFVASNMAVNYVQHKRYMQGGNTKEKKKEAAPEPPQLVVGDTNRRPNTENTQKRSHVGDKATDNYHYDKFRKQARRY